MTDKEAPIIPLMGTIHIPIEFSGGVRIFHCQISAPPPMAPVEDLIKFLESNRQLLNEAEEAMISNLNDDLFKHKAPWILNYEGPIQNALVARFNINILIPLINIKGGKERFTKLESMSVKEHIEKLIFKSEKTLFIRHAKGNVPFNIVFIAAIFVISFTFFLTYLL